MPRGRTLYEISADMARLEEKLIESCGEITPEIEADLFAWRDVLIEQFDDKADDYCALIREFDERALARARESERLAQLARADKLAADNMTARLKAVMIEHGISKRQTARFRLSVCSNGGNPPLQIDELLVPPEYQYQPPPVPDKHRIVEALKAGTQLDFAEFGERGTHLRIK